jgi:predicted PurR-regulated permease PerM
MQFLKEWMKEEATKKFVAIAVLIVLFFSIKSLLNLLLLTFVFTFFFYSIQQFIFEKVNKIFPVRKGVITVFLYLLAIISLAIALIKYTPLLIKELVSIGTEVSSFQFDHYADKIDPKLLEIIQEVNVEEYIKTGGEALVEAVTHVGEFSIHMVLALLLSFFLILEKDEIVKFCRRMERSKIAFLYNYYKQFGKQFLNSFGKVLQIQILISFINAILSVILLTFMGFHQVIGLGFMIFVLGFIPVLGTIISFIPLSIIAFNLGGFPKVVSVIALILILHALESYILNPKLMSIKIKVPVFFTFVVLILSEHFLGIWGLLLGVPLFIFLLDILGIQSNKKEMS